VGGHEGGSSTASRQGVDINNEEKNLYRKKLAKIICQAYFEMDYIKSLTADEACEHIIKKSKLDI
jgi:hypothetical protein